MWPRDTVLAKKSKTKWLSRAIKKLIKLEGKDSSKVKLSLSKQPSWTRKVTLRKSPSPKMMESELKLLSSLLPNSNLPSERMEPQLQEIAPKLLMELQL